MQRLAQSIWSRKSRFHIGDLAWNLKSAERSELEWPIALWESSHSVMAFGWMQSPGELALMVDPEHASLAEEVFDWLERTATSSELRTTILETETYLLNALSNRGYRSVGDGPFDLFMWRRLRELPPPLLPDGFQARHLRGMSELEARAEVHRAAWSALRPNSPVSKMSAKIYARVMATWPYDRELDWVIEGPDGGLAASCIAWFDDKNRVGELEPVGTRPDFRRLGLAHAVCLSALHALRQKGAELAVVYPRGDRNYPVPRKIYGDLGFQPYGRTRTYKRSR